MREDLIQQLIGIGYSLEDATAAVEENFQEEKEEFKIDSRDAAEWLVKKLAKLEATKAENNRIINAEVDELALQMATLEKRRAELNKPLQQSIDFLTAKYTAEAEEWCREQLNGSKAKSFKLVHGTMQIRKSADKFVIDDEEIALYDLSLTAPEAIKKSVLISKIPDEIKATAAFGHVEPGVETFSIKLEGVK